MNPHDTAPTVDAYIGLGANLGDAAQALRDAAQSLTQHPQVLSLVLSPFYASAALDSFAPDYVNAVARLQTSLAPLDLLNLLQNTESDFGRTRPYRYAPRTLDLDLLLYGDQSWDDERLIIPHPRLYERAFVLLPLLDLQADLEIPGIGAAADCLESVKEQRIHRMD